MTPFSRNIGNKLLAFCDGYPSRKEPTRNVFVHTLMKSVKKHGVDVSVIAPDPIFSLTRGVNYPKHSRKQERLEGIPVNRPTYMSYSARKVPFIGSTLRMSIGSLSSSALRVAAKEADRPSVAYGHFLFSGGTCATKVAEYFSIPSVVSLGESSFDIYVEHFGRQIIKTQLDKFDKVIAVSDGLKDKCVEEYGYPPDGIRVIPNAVDPDKFFPRSRLESRKTLRLPLSGIIGIAVGSFSTRKGYKKFHKIVEPIKGLDMIYLGAGPEKPSGKNILYAGEVQHDDVPLWLAAADFFVHPSEAEGSSNAILEALACGLPTVVNDIASNRELLDEKKAIFFDAGSPAQVRKAISDIVRNPEKRGALASNSKSEANQYTIHHRSKNIVNWLGLNN